MCVLVVNILYLSTQFLYIMYLITPTVFCLNYYTYIVYLLTQIVWLVLLLYFFIWQHSKCVIFVIIYTLFNTTVYSDQLLYILYLITLPVCYLSRIKPWWYRQEYRHGASSSLFNRLNTLLRHEQGALRANPILPLCAITDNYQSRALK